MAEEITMPRLSDTMEEGTIARWHKEEGDALEAGDLLAEIETDKAIMEFEAPESGVLLKIVVPEGDSAPVGSPIAFIGEAGESVPEVKSAAPAAESAPAPAAPPPAAPVPAAPPSPAPAPAPAAATPPSPAPAPAAATSAGGRIKASPLARRIAAERGIDLATIRGTGPGGRIVKRDVESAASAAPAAAATAPAAAPAEPAPAAPGQVTDVPMTPMRATIAKRLLESKTTIPHFYAEMEVDMGPLMSLRKQLNDSLTDLRLSVNDFIVRAAAVALRRVPRVNATIVGNAIRYYGDIHVGVAVSVEDGLITPVVRNADTKGLRQISTEVRDLAERARARRLRVEEFQGGTFTITNLGMFGIRRFNAIINPPEAAILAVGAVVKVPVVVEDRIEIGQRMSVVLSADHRIVDGALGAEYLQVLRELLENPAGLVV